ncbi:MAG: ATPase domain-containing protein [Candidatus Helarchaeota archaeon]
MKGWNKEKQCAPPAENPPKIKTGLMSLDKVLFGGFQKNAVIHLFGMPGSGKTTFGMQIMAHILREGWRGVWVDCNGNFSLHRFSQILRCQDLLAQLTLVHTSSFPQQTQLLSYLSCSPYLNQAGCVVIDGITHHYRSERYQESSHGFFQVLVNQLGSLLGIASIWQIPVIVINYGTTSFTAAYQSHLTNRYEPIAANAFKRVELYRFAFSVNPASNSSQKASHFRLYIEKAPNTFSQHRTFQFQITTRGIEKFQLEVTSCPS